MSLYGQQRKKLQTALIDAFPNQSSLKQMVSFGLDKNLDAIAGGDNLQVIVFNLINVPKTVINQVGLFLGKFIITKHFCYKR